MESQVYSLRVGVAEVDSRVSSLRGGGEEESEGAQSSIEELHLRGGMGETLGAGSRQRGASRRAKQALGKRVARGGGGRRAAGRR